VKVDEGPQGHLKVKQGHLKVKSTLNTVPVNPELAQTMLPEKVDERPQGQVKVNANCAPCDPICAKIEF